MYCIHFLFIPFSSQPLEIILAAKKMCQVDFTSQEQAAGSMTDGQFLAAHSAPPQQPKTMLHSHSLQPRADPSQRRGLYRGLSASDRTPLTGSFYSETPKEPGKDLRISLWSAAFPIQTSLLYSSSVTLLEVPQLREVSCFLPVSAHSFSHRHIFTGHFLQ